MANKTTPTRRNRKTTDYRPEVMAVANGRCTYCGNPDTRELECDHIDPNGPTNATSLQAGCSTCNRVKADVDSVGRRKPFPAIDRTDAVEVGMAMIESWANRERFAREMGTAYDEMIDRWEEWARKEIDTKGRRKSSVLTSIETKQNKRTSGKIAKRLK